MFETDGELADLQDLLDRSFASASEHLLSIMEPQRHLSAARLSAELPSPAVLNISTVTVKGEPRVSAVDGHFLHGRWYFTTATDSPKADHLRARPAISAGYTPRDGYGVFCHGQAVLLDGDERNMLYEHSILTYGMEPGTDWPGDYFRIDPHWMTGFAMTDEEMIQIEAAKAARES